MWGTRKGGSPVFDALSSNEAVNLSAKFWWTALAIKDEQPEIAAEFLELSADLDDVAVRKMTEPR
jgi:hypothetical protein